RQGLGHLPHSRRLRGVRPRDAEAGKLLRQLAKSEDAWGLLARDRRSSLALARQRDQRTDR
ncbi:MAG: hypothetical protein KDA24_29450, partial [Deltaproteobacteria bacterium]|nr:hypothetical protein [Deltaproteobacteria bacterium]